MHKKFLTSIQWVIFETLGYYGILFIHQLFLFQITEPELYGRIGTAFGIIYFSALFLTFGFEGAVAPMRLNWSTSQQGFKNFLQYQILSFSSIALVGIIAGIIFGLLKTNADIRLLFGIGSIIFLESTRKILKMMVQFLFKNHLCATIELTSIITYCLAVWFLVLSGWTQSLALVLMPLFITLICAVLSYIMILYKWFITLQSSKKLENTTPMKNRLFVCLHQTMNQLFSGNILVPLFATKFGFEVAGSLYIISSFAYTLTSIIQKVYGSTQLAFLSTQASSKSISEIINSKQNWVFFLLIWAFCLSLFFIKHTFNPVIIPLCFILLWIEYAITTQEKKLIIAKKAHLLLVTHLFLPLLIINFLIINTNPEYTLIGIILARLGISILLNIINIKNHTVPSTTTLKACDKSFDI